MSVRTLGFLGAVVLICLACGDEVTEVPGSGGASSASSGDGGSGGTSAMGGSGVGAGPNEECIDDCDAFWECTQLDYEGAPICPGLQGLDAAKSIFTGECLDNPQCSLIGSLIGDGTDPMMCSDGLTLIRSMSEEFDMACSGM